MPGRNKTREYELLLTLLVVDIVGDCKKEIIVYLTRTHKIKNTDVNDKKEKTILMPCRIQTTELQLPK